MRKIVYMGLGLSLALGSFASCGKKNSMMREDERDSHYDEGQGSQEDHGGTCPVEEAKEEIHLMEPASEEKSASLEKEPAALLEEKAKKLEEKVLSLVKESEVAPSQEKTN